MLQGEVTLNALSGGLQEILVSFDVNRLPQVSAHDSLISDNLFDHFLVMRLHVFTYLDPVHTKP